MAAYTASKAKTITVSTSAADTITLTGTGNYLRIAHNSTSSAIYFTAEPKGTTAVAAVALADDVMAVYPTQWLTMAWPGTGASISVITAGVAVVANFMLHD